MYDSKVALAEYGNHRCTYFGKAGDASHYFIAHHFCLLAADDISHRQVTVYGFYSDLP